MQLRLGRIAEIVRSEGPFVLLKKLSRHAVDLAKIRLLPARHAQLRNYRIAVDELRAKALVMRAGPQDLTIVCTTHCNIKCVMCEHAIEGMVDRQHMDDALVERLAPVIPTASKFQLHGLGEPLISPAFWRLIDTISAAHRGAPFITINSNGLLLNEKTIARILGSKLKEINISIDAATSETYAKIRGADFSKLIANIEALVRTRRASGRDDFRIMLNMTLMRANIEELPAFVRMAKGLSADEIDFWRMSDGEDRQRPEWVVDRGAWRFSYCNESPKFYPNLFNAKIREAWRVGQQIRMPICQAFSKARLIEGEGQREDLPYQPTAAPVGRSEDGPSAREAGSRLPVVEREMANGCATANGASQPATGQTAILRVDAASGIPQPTSATIGACSAPWQWLSINNYGGCAPCCYAQESAGNLYEQTIEEIWNGRIMQEIRASIAQGQVHRACQGASCRFVMGNLEEAEKRHLKRT